MWSTAANEFELYLLDTFNWEKVLSGICHLLGPKSIIKCQTFTEFTKRKVCKTDFYASCRVSNDFLALRLFCFNIRQHGRQILYFMLHVDGRKFHCQKPHRRSQGGKGPCTPQIFRKYSHLCFERCFSKQNSVIHLESNIFPQKKIFWPPLNF